MSLDDKIPNNVNLSSDKRLQRALETWQPDFINWWREMGPSGFQEDQVYLRTAISVDPSGWAHYDYVKMPDYRWGIFLAPPEKDRTIGFGDTQGTPVWNEVPGELRNILRRIIVTQADTEPASVEQQRELGKCAPSLYDLRNLFQVNVEEGRHLWAMVHLLHQFFGRDGREEAEQLLMRRAGNPDTPRILSTFNEETSDWLSFFCFTMFTDRDGKYQLASLAESGFDPLSRATRFMLTEEAFHLFVGETGIDRVLKQSARLTKQDPNGDARKLGGIDLPTVQKYINFWFSSAVELFGGEISNNAADFFGAGLKGRYKEDKYQDHAALEGIYTIDVIEDGKVTRKEVGLRNALNEVLRDEYVSDCERAVRKWNRTIAAEGLSFEISLPHRRFNRSMGIYAGTTFDLAGNPIAKEEFEARRDAWLPTREDRAFVKSLMKPVVEPGQFAPWIAPPAKGVEGTPIEFEYVKGEGVGRVARGEALHGDAEELRRRPVGRRHGQAGRAGQPDDGGAGRRGGHGRHRHGRRARARSRGRQGAPRDVVRRALGAAPRALQDGARGARGADRHRHRERGQHARRRQVRHRRRVRHADGVRRHGQGARRRAVPRRRRRDPVRPLVAALGAARARAARGRRRARQRLQLPGVGPRREARDGAARRAAGDRQAGDVDGVDDGAARGAGRGGEDPPGGRALGAGRQRG